MAMAALVSELDLTDPVAIAFNKTKPPKPRNRTLRSAAKILKPVRAVEFQFQFIVTRWLMIPISTSQLRDCIAQPRFLRFD